MVFVNTVSFYINTHYYVKYSNVWGGEVSLTKIYLLTETRIIPENFITLRHIGNLTIV
jgi:hypothetical protein